MRAVGLDFERRELVERDRPEPLPPGQDEVLFAIHEVGVCGTDRDLARFRLGGPPAGESFLTLGHEALGQVRECGPAVEGIRRGDWIVPMVRRGCEPPCISCARGRRDLCVSHRYCERGIIGMHGYFTEYAVDNVGDVVVIPEALVDLAVLIEPMSVVEKAVEVALRLHEPGAASAVVLGAGPIGLLAALVLELRGIRVTISSLEPEDHPRARLVRDAGIAYGTPDKADIVIEATGTAEGALRGLQMLGSLGVYVVLGATDPHGKIPFSRIVLHNQIIAGSVNASPRAFTDAVADLARLPRNTLKRMIRRVSFSAYRESILSPPPAAPKIVHVL